MPQQLINSILVNWFIGPGLEPIPTDVSVTDLDDTQKVMKAFQLLYPKKARPEHRTLDEAEIKSLKKVVKKKKYSQAFDLLLRFWQEKEGAVDRKKIEKAAGFIGALTKAQDDYRNFLNHLKE